MRIPDSAALLLGACWRLGWKAARRRALKRDRFLVAETAAAFAARPGSSALLLRVGSLRAGGGGRTTVVSALARAFGDAGIRTALLSFDRRFGRETVRVEPGSGPDRFGDDALLLARTGLPVFVSGDLFRSAAKLREEAELLLLDGGLEDPRFDLLPGVETVVLERSDLPAPRSVADLLPGGPFRSFGRDRRGARFWTVGAADADVLLSVDPAPRAGARIRLATGVGDPRGAARLLRAAGAAEVALFAARDHSAPSLRRALGRARSAGSSSGDLWLFEKDAVKLDGVPEGATVAGFVAGGRRLGLFVREIADAIRARSAGPSAPGPAAAAASPASAPSRAKRRGAVLGGAFDPIHADHVRLARECLEWKMADEVLFVVAPDVRWDKRTVAGAEDRLEMVRLATAGMENVSVSREEIDAGEYRGSLRMLERLERAHPDREFALVVGSDSYPRIPSWRDQTEGWKPNGEELLRRFSLMVWPRPGAEMPDPVAHREKGWATLVLPPQKAWTTASPISSTQVRELLARGESADALLPPAVAAYIARKKLYAVIRS